MKNRLVEKITKEVKKKFKGAKGSHDWEHTLRVYKLVVHIGAKEGACLTVIKLAAIMHDIARGIEDASNGRIDHAKRGAKIAFGILAKYGVPLYKAANVVHSIACHRFRGKLKPKTLEAKCLYDADKLDSIGAVGIGRAFLFAGEVGAKLHNKRADILKTKPYTSEDTAYREYMVKLRRVKARIKTKEGKRLASGRHEFMTLFFERLNKEAEGKI